MESKQHINMKYKIKGISQKFGYKCQLEMFSPFYVPFLTNKPKKFIDVWCEYSINHNESIWGRQIPIEIYNTEKIFLELDKVENQFKIDPAKSFRVVISKNIEQPYTIQSKQSEKYFDMHLISWNHLKPFIQILKIGRAFLIENFKPKIEELTTYVAGIRYSKISNDIWKGINFGDELLLKREDNKYDKYAIEVIYDKNHIGYIPKDYSKDISQNIDLGINYICVVDNKFGNLKSKPMLTVRLIKEKLCN